MPQRSAAEQSLPSAGAADSCPFCASRDIKTTSKDVTASTYWRCVSCGQIWNSGRLAVGRPSPSRRYL